ncbi:MAG: FAD-dependent oxidoreductase [Motiliproteus sp.]
MSLQKIALFIVFMTLAALFFVFDLQQLFSLEYFKQNQADFKQSLELNPYMTGGGFFLIYVLVTALSLPGAAVMTLAAGALFGFGWGLLLVSFASSIGATIAFIVSRYLFRGGLERRFGNQLQSINEGIERDGAFYLFTLRLVPIFPFFVINLVMGLTHLRTLTFYWVSQIGMLAGTMVFVNAGTQLGQIDSLSGILSPGLLASFCLLGIFPLLAKRAIQLIHSRKLYQGIDKPTKFDTNMVVIGAGSAGLVSAYIAAAAKAKVSLIEKNKMGGDCLNTGCVPSKALLRSARFVAEAKRSAELGIGKAELEYDFAEIMERVQRVIKTVEPHDSIERYTSLGVDCIKGAAQILSPYRVKVNDQVISTRNIVIATGARPAIPPISNIEAMEPFTSDTIWSIRQQPKRMLILGGGPIGCELTQAFQRLGTQVIQVLRGPRLLPKEDAEIALQVQQQLVAEGVDLRLNHKMVEFINIDGEKRLRCEHDGKTIEIGFDLLLVATGRKANVSGFGLDQLDIPLTADGRIEVNDYLQTRYPNIYACGDVCSPYQFTHTAAHQAWYVVVNSLLGGIKQFKVDYSVIPAATFTEPELARVGLNELEAKQQGIEYEVTEFDLEELDRAIADESASGTVKILTQPGKDKILGATIVGPHAGELINEFTLSMKHGLGLNKILGTIHIYPTLSEANKYAAGQWKRNHVPQRVMGYLERFHSWRRG